jgi:preprotein translocase subunit SecG
MICWKLFKINTKVMVALNKIWKISIVLFIFGGLALAPTYTIFANCYPSRGLPTECPDPFWYYLVGLTAAFFVSAIVLLIISRKRTNSSETK